MSIKVVVFDLDDTLYHELDYVKSGFYEVAKYLNLELIPKKSIKILYNRMLEIMELNGRGKVFDTVLSEHNVFNLRNTKKCLSIYRMHTPKVKLDDGVTLLLKSLKNYPLYLVTDGNKIVQEKKILALNIKKFFNKTFITHRYGVNSAKPSLKCFELIKKREKCSWSDMVYIGDNPNKDFINCKKVGMKKIRVVQGAYKNVKKDKPYEADIKVDNVLKIKKIIIKF